MSHIKLSTRAKLNWTIDVLSRREDGYHEVDMLMSSINVFDTLTLTLGGERVDVICEYPFAPSGDANIASETAKMFLREIGKACGVHIHIQKRIPVGAGMAGGSADAAGVLVGLNHMFKQPLTTEELCTLALRIGADVPFCIRGGLQRAQGIGERLTALQPGHTPLCIVMVKPNGAVSTQDVYRALELSHLEYRPNTVAAQQALLRSDSRSLAPALGNVLRTVTSRLCPSIQILAQALLDAGAIGVNMTGSGPTMYGLFPSLPKAIEGLSAIRRHNDAEWCCVAQTEARSITIDELVE